MNVERYSCISKNKTVQTEQLLNFLHILIRYAVTSPVTVATKKHIQYSELNLKATIILHEKVLIN